MKYLVQSVAKATTKNGKEYLRLRLLEEGGRGWPAVFWTPGSLTLETGQYIDALTEESSFGGEAQLTVKAARVIGKATDDSFLPRTAQPVDGMMSELNSFIGLVKHPSLRQLLATVVEDPRWKRAPAAKQLHHAYLGGLLEHVVGLCRLAAAVAALYKELDLDLLLIGAILHDVGKMDEMDCGTNIEYTNDGTLLGHIGIGLLRVDRLMDEDTEAFGSADKPTNLRRHVRHIIASHHGSMQYGAIKPPMTLEATIFSNLDGIDANMGKMRAAIERAGPGKEWSDKVGWEQQLYLGPKDAK